MVPRATIAFLMLIETSMLSSSLARADSMDISYGEDRLQKLDVYSAVSKGGDNSSSSPVVIWVHGGGWRNGDKDNRSGSQLCQTWAKEGITMVNLNYRLSPTVVHPAHIQDVAAGVAWVHKNIDRYGGDPKRIFLLGHSAGAHLVALVATAPEFLQAHQLEPKDVLAGVMAIDTASYDLNTTHTPAVRKMISDAFGSDPITLSQASPLLQAKKNPQQCPPFMIAAVKQRAEAVEESKALAQVLPNSKLILQDYSGSGQLRAHGLIARDLMDTQNSMTSQLLTFVKSTRH